MNAPKAPSKLGPAGRRLWSSISEKYELRADEQRVLEDACREADLVDKMAAELASDALMVTGSMGQPVVNPMVAEVRQHRSTLAALLRGLKLPDDEGGSSEVGGGLSAKNREAANARWSRRGA